MPRAIKATFFRIVLFYILTILTIGLCINHGDESLLTAAFGEFYGLDLVIVIDLPFLTFLISLNGLV